MCILKHLFLVSSVDSALQIKPIQKAVDVRDSLTLPVAGSLPGATFLPRGGDADIPAQGPLGTALPCPRQVQALLAGPGFDSVAAKAIRSFTRLEILDSNKHSFVCVYLND